MKQLRCIVIDDEPMALKKMKAYIAKVPFLSLMGLCESPFEAMPLLAEEQVDAMFVDINMPDMNGLDFLASLAKQPLVVFTTAHAEYGVESYKYAAIDYLLKPFDFVAFQRAANKLYKYYSVMQGTVSNDDSCIYVKIDYRYVNVRVADILYAKGMSEYVQLFVVGGKPLMAHMSMKQLKEHLPNYFLQVHRSYIVNMRQVKEIERMRITMNNETIIPISENFKKDFLSYMETHLISKKTIGGKSGE